MVVADSFPNRHPEIRFVERSSDSIHLFVDLSRRPKHVDEKSLLWIVSEDPRINFVFVVEDTSKTGNLVNDLQGRLRVLSDAREFPLENNNHMFQPDVGPASPEVDNLQDATS